MDELIRIIEKQDRKLVKSAEGKGARKGHRTAFHSAHVDVRIQSEALLDG